MNVLAASLMLLPLVLVTYAYVIYPGLLKLSAYAGRWSPPTAPSGPLPKISITLAAYNEEEVIAQAIEALLLADYPADRRQIVVISDGSTDQTNGIVSRFADRGVELLELPERRGKTAAENLALSALRGDIMICTDASVRIRPDALRPLVAAFADPHVGVASGHDVSVATTTGTHNSGESAYVDYEMWIRGLETNLGSIVGASGCLYAIRKTLHSELVPEGLSRDFAAPLIARERGFRSVAVKEAVCIVPRASSLRQEYHRKVRTMTRGLQTLSYKRCLLNPFRYGIFAWMLLSHKLARWLVPWAVGLGIIGAMIFALTDSRATWVLGAAVIVGGVLAWLEWMWPGRWRFVAIPAYVMIGLVAGVHAWLRIFSRDQNPMWEPTRRPPAEAR